jgi:uncharacterized membrane protein
MDRKLIGVGRTFFALALIGLGIEHVLFGEFVTGRAPAWPVALAGGTLWAYATGLVIVLAAMAILVGRHARIAAVGVALLIAAWALLRHPSALVEEAFLSGAWTRAGKALVLTAGALTVAATLPKATSRFRLLANAVNRHHEFIAAGRFSLGAFLVMTGIQHFLATAFVASLIPRWFPGDAVFWTYFAGVALIAGGTGLLTRRLFRLAALLSGVMVFSWFWIIHVPRTAVGISDSIAVFEALAVSGIAFVIAGADTARRR